MQKHNWALITAGTLGIVAAIIHILMIFGGPDWYRFFGAGEEMARMAERGEAYPAIVTLCISVILAAWGLYAFSGAGLIARLPFLRACLIIITGVYCIRGCFGLLAPWVSSHPYVQALGVHFWLWSSAICLFIGLVHLLGVRSAWGYLSRGRMSQRGLEAPPAG